MCPASPQGASWRGKDIISYTKSGHPWTHTLTIEPLSDRGGTPRCVQLCISEVSMVQAYPVGCLSGSLSGLMLNEMIEMCR